MFHKEHNEINLTKLGKLTLLIKSFNYEKIKIGNLLVP